MFSSAHLYLLISVICDTDTFAMQLFDEFFDSQKSRKERERNEKECSILIDVLTNCFMRNTHIRTIFKIKATVKNNL